MYVITNEKAHYSKFTPKKWFILLPAFPMSLELFT